MMGDFVVDTNGRCFLCLIRDSEFTNDSGPKPTSAKYSSFTYLFRHLKLNMRNVFTEIHIFAPTLLANAEKTRVKVELCEECTSLNEMVSELCQKLEKIEIELSSCVSRVHGKLTKSNEADSVGDDGRHNEKFINLGNGHGNERKSEIANALRAELTKRCCQKLTQAIPRVKIQRLRMNQINGQSHSSKLDSRMKLIRTRQKDNKNFISTTVQMPDVETSQFKVEEMSDHDQDPLQDDVDVDMTNIFLDNDDDDDHQPKTDDDYYSNGLPLMTVVEQHGVESKVKKASELASPPAGGSRRKCKLQLRKTDEVGPPVYEKDTPVIPNSPPTGMEASQTSSWNRANFSCHLCSKNFHCPANLHKHVKNVHHQLMNYPCTFCELTFELKSDLTRHCENDHIRIQSKCKYCSKTYSSLIVAKMHEKNCCPLRPRDELGEHRLSCLVCGVTFSSPCYLRRHSLSCGKAQEHECQHCGRIFAKRKSLNSHRRVHFTRLKKMN